MIEKPSIIVTSLGRTGTDFFAKFFSAVLPDTTALHEPDIFQNTGMPNKWGHFLRQIRRAGVGRMVFLKALGKWTLINLSDAKFSGRANHAQTIDGLRAQRRAFIDTMRAPVYVEANIGYYGMLDITPAVFREHKAVYIIRDGRDWIRSHMNWGEFYGKSGFRKLISHNWPTASDLMNDPYASQWDALSRFERLCWAWARLNEYGLEATAKNSAARVFKFENIFSPTQGYATLNELLSFTSSLSAINPAQVGSVNGWLERKIHPSVEGFPAWENWTDAQKDFFTNTCGELMQKVGYW